MFTRIILSIVLYIICILLLYKYKPSIMFKANGELKIFDYESDNKDGTLLPIEIILVIIAMICYLLVLCLELLISK